MSHGRISPVWFRQEVVPQMIATTKERRRRLRLAVLCEMLVLYAGLAQPSIAQATAQANLRVVVVEGEGAKNVAQQIAAKQLTVRVLDANNRPVEGAAVTFIAPASGPSGDFTNDSKSIRVLTNSDGVANAGPYHPNATTGAYLIQVRTEFQRALATVNISQMNVGQSKSHKKMIAIIAIAGAAAGAAIAAHGGSSSSSSGAPTITLGGTAVGAPK
jgi:hypothetical protein